MVKRMFLVACFLMFLALLRPMLLEAVAPYGVVLDVHSPYKGFKYSTAYAVLKYFPQNVPMGYFVQPRLGVIAPTNVFNDGVEDTKGFFGARIGFFAPYDSETFWTRLNGYLGANFSPDLRWLEMGASWGGRIHVGVDYNIYGAPANNSPTRIISEFEARLGYWVNSWLALGYAMETLNSGTSDEIIQSVRPRPGGLFVRAHLYPLVLLGNWQRQEVKGAEPEKVDNFVSATIQFSIGAFGIGGEDNE